MATGGFRLGTLSGQMDGLLLPTTWTSGHCTAPGVECTKVSYNRGRFLVADMDLRRTYSGRSLIHTVLEHVHQTEINGSFQL